MATRMSRCAMAIWRMSVDLRDILLRYIYPYITQRPAIPRFPTGRKLAQYASGPTRLGASRSARLTIPHDMRSQMKMRSVFVALLLLGATSVSAPAGSLASEPAFRVFGQVQ